MSQYAYQKICRYKLLTFIRPTDAFGLNGQPFRNTSILPKKKQQHNSDRYKL